MSNQIAFRMTSTNRLEELKEVPSTCRNCRLHKVKCSRTYPCARCIRLTLECVIEAHAPRPLELASAINSLKQDIDSVSMRLKRFEVNTTSHSMECDLTPVNDSLTQKEDDGSVIPTRTVEISKMISSVSEAVKRMKSRLDEFEKRYDGGYVGNNSITSNDDDDNNELDGIHYASNKTKDRIKEIETQQSIESDIPGDEEMKALSVLKKTSQQLKNMIDDSEVELLWRLILTEKGLKFDSKITTYNELNEVIHQLQNEYFPSMPSTKSHTDGCSAHRVDYSSSPTKPISKSPFMPRYTSSCNQTPRLIPSASFPSISFVTKNLTDALVHIFMTYRCCSFTHINAIEPKSFQSRYHSFNILNDSFIKNPFEALVLSICSFTARHGMKEHSSIDYPSYNIDISYAYNSRARLILEDYFDQPSLDIIQAILYITHFSPKIYPRFDRLSSDSTLLWLAVRMLLEIKIYNNDAAKSFPKRELREFKLVQIAIGMQIPWCGMLYANSQSDALRTLFGLIDIAGSMDSRYIKDKTEEEEGEEYIEDNNDDIGDDKDNDDTSKFYELCNFGLQISRFILDIIDHLNSSDLSNYQARTVEIQSRISKWCHSLPPNWSFSALVHRPRTFGSSQSSYSCRLALWSMLHTTNLSICNVSSLAPENHENLNNCLRLAIEITEHAEHAHATGYSCLLHLYNLRCAWYIFNVFLSFNDERTSLALQYSNRLLLAIKK